MTHTKDKALKLALEALENHCGNYKLDDAGCDRHEKAITAINEALAQPEQEPVACLSKTQAKAILGLALDLEKTGRMVVLTEGQERTDFAARNRNIQCVLEDALRNATTSPVAAQPEPDNMSSILSELNALYGKITPPPYFVAPDGRGIGLSGNRWTANGAFQNVLKEGVSRHGGTSADNMRFICSVVNSWTQISVMLATPPAAPALDRIKAALPEFRQQDDYLLAHGASLLSEQSHEIIHVDTALRIAGATPPAAAQPAAPDFKAFKAWANDAGYDTAYTNDGVNWICLNPMTADLWKVWQAAHGIK
jgi:hypothetical protein